MSWNRWLGALGSWRASISASRLTTDIWSKFMLFQKLCCAKLAPPIGALSSTKMHSCSIRLDTHAVFVPTVERVPTSVEVADLSSHRFGVAGVDAALQSHGVQPGSLGAALGGLRLHLQNSLWPICGSSPSVQSKWIAAR